MINNLKMYEQLRRPSIKDRIEKKYELGDNYLKISLGKITIMVFENDIKILVKDQEIRRELYSNIIQKWIMLENEIISNIILKNIDILNYLGGARCQQGQ